MRRFRTTIVLALATLVPLSICSGQQAATTAVNALGNVASAGATPQGKAAEGGRNNLLPCNPVTSMNGGVANNIAMWDAISNCDLSTSLMSQDVGASVVTDNGNFNLLNIGVAYQIGGQNVLRVGSGPSVTTFSSVFVGAGAGANNVSPGGNNNTFVGYSAGNANTGQTDNTFIGYQAGMVNTVTANTFIGSNAGSRNETGVENTFLGFKAGHANTDGTDNTFIGYLAGSENGQGTSNNTFIGSNAGKSNVTGNSNVFMGVEAGKINVGGQHNTFIGYQAGVNVNDGRDNTFVGYQNGISTIDGHNNTYIGANMHPSDESDTIRIGTAGAQQQHAFIDGAYNVITPSGVQMYINNEGRLGTSPSSRRFKEQVRDMDASSSNLFRLRPVTFLYKQEYEKGLRTLEYGLIAEEVAEVYPEMVAYDKDGQPLMVKYQYLPPMLLNELQKQHAVVASQQKVIETQQTQIQAQGQQIANLQERLSRLESFIAKK